MNFFFQRIFSCFLALENYILTALFKRDLTDTNINELIIKINETMAELKIEENNFIDFKSLKCLLLNFFIDPSNNDSKEIADIYYLPDMQSLIKQNNYENIQKQHFRTRTMLELYLNKFLKVNSIEFINNDSLAKELDFWFAILLENHKNYKEKSDIHNKYPVFFYICQ